MTDRIDLSAGPPPIPAGLVEYLERLWPDRFPSVVGTSCEAVALGLAKIAGAREVIQYLREHHERQSAARQATIKPPSPF